MSASTSQYTPQGTITGSSTSKLSQDAIVAATVPVYASPSPIAAFVNLTTGFTEALAVSIDSTGAPQLAHITRSVATGSESAWVTNSLGATAHEVAAGTAFLGVQGTQQVYGFYHDGVSLYGIQLNGDTWTSGGSPLGDAITGLKVAYSPSGVLVLYGVGSDGNLVTYWQTPGSPFTGVEWTLPVSADVQLVLNDGTDATNWQASSITNGQLTIAQGQFTPGMSARGEPASVKTVPESNASQVVMGFWNQSLASPAFLYLDSSGTLNSYCGQSVQIQQNVTIASAAGYQGNGVLPDGTPYTSVHLYSIDSNNALSVLHQNPQNPFDTTPGSPTFGAPNFTQLLGLTTGVTSVVADMNPADAPTLFAVDNQQLVPGVNMVRLHWQDAQTNYWRTDYMYTQAPTTIEVSRYRSEVTIVDGNGIPVPNFPLTLAIGSQYSAIDIASGGQSYHLSSSSPLNLTTNAHGKLTFSVVANSGLAIPAINVTGAGVSLTVQANSEIHDYLAGTGTLNNLPPFSSSTLGGKNGPPISNQTNVGVAAAGLTQLGQTGQSLSNNSGVGSQDALFGFHIDMRDAANPKFTAFHDQASYDAALKSIRMESFGLFDFASDFVEDVVHAVEQGVAAVDQVIVNVANGIVTSIGMTVFGTLVTLIVNTLEDVAHAISTAFMWVVSSIEDVINWLKALFNMGAIIRTMNAFQSALVQMIGDGTASNPGYINTSLVSYTSQAQTWLTNQQVAINSYLATLANNPSSFGSLAGFSAPGVPNSSPMGATTVSPSDCTSSVHSNFFQEKVSSSGAAGGSVDNGLSGASATFSQNLQTAFGDFTTAFGTFLTAIAGVINDPSSIGSAGMGTFITPLRKIIDGLFAFAQAVLGELASLAEAVANTIAGLLNTAIDSSFLQAIWTWIGGDGPLTISAVISLLAAFPVTIIYTLIIGQEPFPGQASIAMTADAADAADAAVSPLPLVGAIMEILLIIPAGIALALGQACPWYLTLLLVALSVLIFFFNGAAQDFTTVDWEILGTASLNLAWILPAAYFIMTGAEAQANVTTLGDLGKCVTTLAGALTLIFASIAAAENSTPPPTSYQTANNILYSLPSLFAFLRTSAATAAFPAGAPAMSGAIMTVGYVGGGIAALLGTEQS